MKLNNYQKILITWGVLLAIGYCVSFNLLSNKLALLSIWTFIGAIGLGTQVWLGYAKDTKTILIQLAWISVVVFGIIFTYLELRFGIKIGLHGMSSGWFFMCSGAMLFIALLASAIVCTTAPLRIACLIRCANKGRTLRILDPMINAR